MRPIEVRVVNRFKLLEKVEGNHRRLLLRGVHVQTQERVFIKAQLQGEEDKSQTLRLSQESKVMQMTQGGFGVPSMHWSGKDEDYFLLIMEELGQSIPELLLRCGSFSSKTVVTVGREMLKCLQYLHFKGLSFNQLCPRNILLSRSSTSQLFLVDYSSASMLRPNQSPSLPRTTNIQYSSRNYQRGGNITRSDDLESLLFLMLYLHEGTLPWLKLLEDPFVESKERRIGVPDSKTVQSTHSCPTSPSPMKSEINMVPESAAVLKMKQETPSVLFKNHHYLQQLFGYLNELKEGQTPRYEHFSNVFAEQLQQMGAVDDRVYDWVLLDDFYSDHPEPELALIPNEVDFLRQLQKELEEKNTRTMNSSQQPTASTLIVKKQSDCVVF